MILRAGLRGALLPQNACHGTLHHSEKKRATRTRDFSLSIWREHDKVISQRSPSLLTSDLGHLGPCLFVASFHLHVKQGLWAHTGPLQLQLFILPASSRAASFWRLSVPSSSCTLGFSGRQREETLSQPTRASPMKGVLPGSLPSQEFSISAWIFNLKYLQLSLHYNLGHNSVKILTTQLLTSWRISLYIFHCMHIDGLLLHSPLPQYLDKYFSLARHQVFCTCHQTFLLHRSLSFTWLQGIHR